MTTARWPNQDFIEMATARLEPIMRRACQGSHSGCDIVFVADPPDVPHLYAYHRLLNKRGRHDVACGSSDLSLDIWVNGRSLSPDLVKANASEDEAVAILVKDYEALKASYVALRMAGKLLEDEREVGE